MNYKMNLRFIKNYVYYFFKEEIYIDFILYQMLKTKKNIILFINHCIIILGR